MKIVKLTIADGGDGFLDVLCASFPRNHVKDLPLDGQTTGYIVDQVQSVKCDSFSLESRPDALDKLEPRIAAS